MNYAPHHPMADRRVAPPATRSAPPCAAASVPSPPSPAPAAQRPGMTLIELLIVIVILATLTAAALPLLTPSTTERRIREASREVNAYLAQAQAKAQRAQRPYGVALKRLSSDTGGNAENQGVCIELVEVEQPVPYAGFDENSRMRVALNPNTSQPGTVLLDFVTRGMTNPPGSDGLPPGWDADLLPPDLLRLNDIVELLGTRYRILLVDANVANPNVPGFIGAHNGSPNPARLVATPLNDSGQVINPAYDNGGNRLSVVPPSSTSPTPFWTEPAKYKIYRQPVTTSAPVLQLPEGSAIDLEASGIMGEVPFHFAALTPRNTPIYLMFGPEGSIERVQYERSAPDGSLLSNAIYPTSNVALLVGRRENIPANTTLNLTAGTETEREAEKAKINWLNLESRWIIIGAQTGSVVTTENAFVSVPIPAGDYDNDNDQDGSQLETRMGQIQAAQEFARGMSRAGGG